jgi:hypothetical protein
MIIIGCDYHPGFQQIAIVDTETGDCEEQRLEHCEGAQKFYRDLASQGKKVRVGMEASGHARWFERLLEELKIELGMGDAEVIRAKRGRKPKTDREDALHILKLVLTGDFPKIWVASWENRDLRQLLWHRHRMVQARTRAVASGSSERRTPVQEEAVEGARTRATGKLSSSPLGEPATRGSAAVAGSAEPDDCRTDASDRARSREVPTGAALDDASWGGCTDGISLGADHRKSRTISVREADQCLSGSGALGGLKRRTATAGTYHQAGQFSAALLVSGSGTGYQPYDSRMAQ